MAEAPTVRRLHVSGLAPSTTAADLVSRFSWFGEVVGGQKGVSGLGVDGNGTPKTYAFVSLETTDAKLTKCTSMLSGSTWKGRKLKIALANPDYTVRLEKERREAAEPAVKPAPKKKRKVNSDPSVGTMARNFELVTTANITKHRGWTLDSTPTPTPLFPLLARPSHPLPDVPPKAAATSWTRDSTKAKASKSARAALRSGAPLSTADVLTRARIVRIDPRRWGRKKIVYDEGENVPLGGSAGQGLKGEWVCLDPEDSQASTEEVEWVYRMKDGSIRRNEVIRLTQRSRPHTDRFTALLDNIAGAGAAAVTEINLNPTPLASSQSSLMLDTLPTEVVPATRPRSLSPPPYVSSAPRTLIYNEEDSFALLAATQVGVELEEARQRERDAQLKVLLGVLGDAAAVEEGAKKDGVNLPAVEGFGEDDGEDDEDFVLRLRGGSGEDEEVAEYVMRLRGGAGSDDSDNSSDSDSDASEESSEETLDAGMDVEEAAVSAKTPQKGSLKNIFQPQEEGESFNLFSGIELDLEEPVEREPTPPPVVPAHHYAPKPTPAFTPPTALGRANRNWVGTGPVTNFFAFPSGKFEDHEGDLVQSEVEKLGLSMEKAEALKRESTARLEAIAGDFWRKDSTETIEAEHQALRDALRGHARKRHREASKRVRKAGRSKRTGGGGGVDGA